MKLKVFIHAKYQEWDKRYAFEPWSMDMSDQDVGPLVGTAELDFEPPPIEVLTKETIQQYRDMQTKILAEAEMKRAELDQKINDLLCIEYKPESVEA